MNGKYLLVSLIAVLAIVFSVISVSASVGELTDNWKIEVNGVDVDRTLSISAGETIPIKIVFDAVSDARDVRVKAWLAGYRSEVSDSTDRFDLVNESRYVKHLSLKMPSDIDRTEEYTLVIRIESKTKSDEETYDLKLQRESYNIKVLEVIAPSSISAGSVVPVTVILKNIGMHELEDLFVVAKITALNTEKKSYFGDLTPEDDLSGFDDNTDAVERTIFLVIPSDAKGGVYDLEVEAYNADVTFKATEKVVVTGIAEVSEVVAAITSKSIARGEEVTYELVILNRGSKMRVYSLLPEDVRGLIVNVDEQIVTVSGDSSKVVKVRVRASETAEEGTYSFAVAVNSDSELVKKVNLSANVTKGRLAVASPVVVLTIVLAIIFVVLLIVLIVLLTRKPAKEEEAAESYY